MLSGANLLDANSAGRDLSFATGETSELSKSTVCQRKTQGKTSGVGFQIYGVGPLAVSKFKVREEDLDLVRVSGLRFKGSRFRVQERARHPKL